MSRSTLVAGIPAAFLTALLCLASLGHAQTGRIQVTIEGVNGAVRDNVRSVLSLASAAREGELPIERVRRLHARAPGEIRLALQPFGFYRPQIESGLQTPGDRWTAQYRIDPGPPLRTGRLTVELRGVGADDPQLQAAADRFPLREGAPLEHASYEAGKAALTREAADRGYLDARFMTSEMRIDLEAYTSEIVLLFETGPRFFFGPVVFNQDVLDPDVLRGYVTFQPGEPFSASRLLELQRALSGGPYFGRVEVLPRRDQADSLRVPIEVDLEPRRPQRYELGVGYGTDTGPRGTFEAEHRRLNRHGHRAGAELKASDVEQSITGRYLIPSRYPRTSVLTLYAGFARLDPRTSDSDKILVGASLARLRGDWQEVLSLSFEREAFDVGPDTGRSNLLIPSASWSRTWADDRVFPTHGQRVRINLMASHDAVLSSASFAQARINAKFIRSLMSRTRLIARADLGATYTSSFDEFRELPPTVRFFAGGDQSVRGFSFRALGPAELGADGIPRVIGGRALAVASIELEQRFLNRWAIAAFYDAGNAFEFDAANLPGLSNTLKQGTGLGLRWLSPIGMVRADAAFGVSEDDVPFRFHLVIGPDL